MGIFSDFGKLVTRAPRPSTSPGGLPQLAANEDGPLAVTDYQNFAPLQFCVLNRIVNLSSLVQIDTPIMRLRRPERLTTFSTWIKKITFYLLYYNALAIVFVRDPKTNKIVEIHAFPDTVKPTVSLDNKYTYTEGERVYADIPEDDILVFTSSSVFAPSTIREGIIKGEQEYWKQFWNVSNLRGLVSPDSDTFADQFKGVGQREKLKAMGTEIASQSVAVLPTHSSFQSATPQEKLLDLQEAVLRQWCAYYGCPNALMGIDLPTHNESTLTASYGALVRQVLMPLLEQVFEGISDYYTFNDSQVMPIVSSYERIEKAGMTEIGDVLMKMAQTDSFTRDEIRDMADKDKLPGGEGKVIAQGAGKTDTEGAKDESGEA